MSGRTIAIGDVHGCSAALEAVLGAVDPRGEDTLVMLGDYVDRGVDVRGVIDRLLALRGQCRLIPILGNHDEMMLDIIAGDRGLLGEWLMFGDNTTLLSYDCVVPDNIPEEHVAFLKGCVDYHESDGHFFVHASYISHLPLDKQPPGTLRWESLRDRMPEPHCSGKAAIVGHTSQKDGKVLDLGYLKCIDTFCYGDGWLTAIDVESGQIWQANKEGMLKDEG